MIDADKRDLDQIDDLMQRLVSKLQLVGVNYKDVKKVEDVCYDILYEIEQSVQGIS